MTKGDLVDMLVGQSKEYAEGAQKSLVRNRHMNEIKEDEIVEQRLIDAVVTDLVNYLAAKQGIDLAMYTVDLKT